jgi:hypothetical protein
MLRRRPLRSKTAYRRQIVVTSPPPRGLRQAQSACRFIGWLQARIIGRLRFCGPKNTAEGWAKARTEVGQVPVKV